MTPCEWTNDIGLVAPRLELFLFFFFARRVLNTRNAATSESSVLGPHETRAKHRHRDGYGYRVDEHCRTRVGLTTCKTLLQTRERNDGARNSNTRRRARPLRRTTGRPRQDSSGSDRPGTRLARSGNALVSPRSDDGKQIFPRITRDRLNTERGRFFRGLKHF